jgi:hypothetical protein
LAPMNSIHTINITQNTSRITIEKIKLYNENNDEITNIMVRNQYNCVHATHASYFRL